MRFDDNSSDLLGILQRCAGVGLWEAVIASGDPFHPDTEWAWSAEFRRLLGYHGIDQFPNVVSSWFEALHPDDVEATLVAVSAAIDDPAPVVRYQTKFRLRCASGTYRWFRAVGGVLHDHRGTAIHACGSLIDIHDGETAEAERDAMIRSEDARLCAIGQRLRLISINAMIEAARLGAQGAAFGVVAQEISALGHEIDKLVGRSLPAA